MTDATKLIAFFQGDAFARSNGVQLVEVREGYARTQVHIEPRHLNAGGFVQGSVLFLLADLAFAAATCSHGTLTVTVSSTITFTRSVSQGTVTAEAREIVDHRRLPYCEVRITDDSQHLLAIFNATGYRKDIEIPL